MVVVVVVVVVGGGGGCGSGGGGGLYTVAGLCIYLHCHHSTPTVHPDTRPLSAQPNRTPIATPKYRNPHTKKI